MTNNCIISLATKSGNYANGLARLSNSLRNNFDGDFLGWLHETSVGAPLHSENPYAFKVYAFQAAINAGYKNILWLDSSAYAIQNVHPVFDHIETNGYIMQDAGHFIGEWANDRAINYFGYSRDELMNVRCYGNAGFLGLNTDSEIAMRFFNLWSHVMEFDLFKGQWNNDNKTESTDSRVKGHRHDMSLGSLIRHKLGMELVSGDEWLQYSGIYDKTANDKIYFKAQGI